MKHHPAEDPALALKFVAIAMIVAGVSALGLL